MVKDLTDEKELRLFFDNLVEKTDIKELNIVISDPPTKEEIDKIVLKLNQVIKLILN